MSEFDQYRSPYSWRYGTSAMRSIWSEKNKRLVWRRLWVALAEVQLEFGLVNGEQVADLRDHMHDIDIERSIEIESKIHHDLMAEIKTYAEQCPIGGGIIHLGATSVDIKDNAIVLQVKDSLALIINGLEKLLLAFTDKIFEYSKHPIIAFTHLQPAEPTTLGFRFAQYAQDLYFDLVNLYRSVTQLKGKGFRGAVGTSASYTELLGIENLIKFETLLSEKIKIDFFPITNQTYPRKQDYQILSHLAGLGASIYKLAFDIRFLQTPSIGELSEPFERDQVGSSAMPFKRNPIILEKINSLSRILAQSPRIAWDNGAHSLLERTLDDSANRRSLLPEAFLITDELLVETLGIIINLVVDEVAITSNLEKHGPFAAVERVLMSLGKAGADRQEMHERLRKHSLIAWEAVRRERPNPISTLVAEDQDIQKFISQEELKALFDIKQYLGDAPQRANEFASKIKEFIIASNK